MMIKRIERSTSMHWYIRKKEKKERKEREKRKRERKERNK